MKVNLRYKYLHLAVFTALVFIVSVIFCIYYFLSISAQKKAAASVDSLLQTAQVPPMQQTAQKPLPAIFSFDVPIEPPKPAVSSKPPDLQLIPQILPKYKEIYEKNNDFAGWIAVDGTPIDLPVMYTPKDSEYYLRRHVDKSKNIYGTPFIDARCSLKPRSQNLIIHGHNMLYEDVMFGTLPNYKDKEYFLAHPIIKFDTIYEECNYRVVSAFESVYDENDSATNHYYNYTDLKTQEEKQEFVDLINGLAMYDTGEILQPDDETIMLITCSYHADNGRMTVVAKKIK